MKTACDLSCQCMSWFAKFQSCITFPETVASESCNYFQAQSRLTCWAPWQWPPLFFHSRSLSFLSYSLRIKPRVTLFSPSLLSLICLFKIHADNSRSSDPTQSENFHHAEGPYEKALSPYGVWRSRMKPVLPLGRHLHTISWQKSRNSTLLIVQMKNAVSKTSCPVMIKS